MLPTLSRELILTPEFQRRDDLAVPTAPMLDLPERAVQFGTGAFLRGFVDHFVDRANREGRFGGRIVMVGSTGSGRDQLLNEQDGLFTLSVQGIEGGVEREERRVIGSVSRAVSSRDQWDEVLACARDPRVEVVFSNTTEVGIALDEGDAAELAPPRSFPGKLTRFLLERARAFGFDAARGVVVVPCELIEDNGDRLREIVLALAERWGLGAEFARWVREAVPFCNTLVDRIVPGAPAPEALDALQDALGYRDGMVTTCEPYRLFAIEAAGPALERLRWLESDPGVVLTDDVAPYRLRKVRLLNGGHTVMVPAALLAGCETVAEAVRDELVGQLLRRVMLEEIVPTLDAPGAEAFAREVLDRFANPYIRHALIDITLQQTMKLRVRVVPSIVGYSERTGQVPESLAFGFAAYLLLLRGDVQEQRRTAGAGMPADDQSAAIRALWDSLRPDDAEGLARAACAEASLWGRDLTELPGFAAAVAGHLERMLRVGVRRALAAHLESVQVPA